MNGLDCRRVALLCLRNLHPASRPPEPLETTSTRARCGDADRVRASSLLYDALMRSRASANITPTPASCPAGVH